MKEVMEKIQRLSDLNFFKCWMMTPQQTKSASEVEKELLTILLLQYKNENKIDIRYAKAYREYVKKMKQYNHAIYKKYPIPAQKKLAKDCQTVFKDFRNLLIKREGL